MEKGEYQSAEERSEKDVEKAERIVEVALAKLKWDEDELARRRKGDLVKVLRARRLRSETTMTVEMDRGEIEDGDLDPRGQSPPSR